MRRTWGVAPFAIGAFAIGLFDVNESGGSGPSQPASLSCPPVDYAGEFLTIVHSAVAEDESPVTDLDVESVTIAIVLGSEVIESETPMTWDDDTQQWEYGWDTTGLDPGWYRIQVWITDISGGRVWEYHTFRLAPNP